MRKLLHISVVLAALMAQPAFALSLAPEEFAASRQMACVLAQQALGHLSEKEYGARTHDALDGFDELERDNILSKALGYVDGLMFALDDSNADQVNARLQTFVDSDSCAVESYYRFTVSL